MNQLVFFNKVSKLEQGCSSLVSASFGVDQTILYVSINPSLVPNIIPNFLKMNSDLLLEKLNTMFEEKFAALKGEIDTLKGKMEEKGTEPLASQG